jgi:hypothetical protein
MQSVGYAGNIVYQLYHLFSIPQKLGQSDEMA